MDQVDILFRKYKNNQCNAKEIEELFQQVHDAGDEDILKREIDLSLAEEPVYQQDLQADIDELHDHLMVLIERKSERKARSLPIRWLAAASILLVLGAGIYFLRDKGKPRPAIAETRHEILPGTNKAVLILGNGKQINLTNAGNGKLAQQGKAAIVKTSNGQIVYQNSGSDISGEVSYNTVSVPRGGQYHLTLIDGTQVWLNAQSSITYPSVFNGIDRVVEIKGEAYFEVAHDAGKPFLVKFRGRAVEVLGTRFNINSYENEPFIKTTLVEGKVKMSNGTYSAILKPGQQGLISPENKDGHIQVDEADLERDLGWHSGEFNFKNADIQTVMRQISRWYDVDIRFAGKIPPEHISGTFSRNVPASKALKILQMTGTDIEIAGREIIVK